MKTYSNSKEQQHERSLDQIANTIAHFVVKNRKNIAGALDSIIAGTAVAALLALL